MFKFLRLFTTHPQTEQRDRSVPWIHKSMPSHTAHRTRRVLCSQKSTVRKSTKVARALQRLWCAHLTQLFYADCRGHDLHNLRKTARSSSTVTAWQLAQQSTETPKLLKGHRRRTAGGQMGGSPKAPQQHLAGETSLLGESRSPTAVARAPETSREMATNGWDYVETSILDVGPGQSPVSTKVPSTLE